MARRFFRGIGTNVILLGIVSYFNDLSSEMILPILPMFITALGGSGLVIGLIGGLRESVSHILQVVCGYQSDKSGRRKVFVIWGYSVSAVLKLFLAASRTWHHVLIFAGLERMGKGIRDSPRDAMISESMPRKKGRGFGIHRAFDTAGAISGSVVVFLLFWFFGLGFKTIILIAAILSFLSLIPLHFVKDKRGKPNGMSFRVGLGSLPSSLRLFLVISGIFAFANFSYMFFVLKASDIFSGKMAVAAPMLLYILFNIFYAGFAIPFGVWSDRVGRNKVLVVGYSLFALTCLGFALLDSVPAFIILFATFGLSYAAVEGNQRAFVSDLSSAQVRGTALGTFHTLVGIVKLPAGIAAGLLWQVSPVFTFWMGGALSVVAVGMLVSLKSRLLASQS